MSYYSKDLTEPCSCAAYNDAVWFLLHPNRTRNLRIAWECEQAQIEAQQRAYVTQVVAVVTPKSLNQLAAENNHVRGVMEVPCMRRSFLFIGTPDFARVAVSDEAMVQFLEFINEGTGQLVDIRVH